MKINELLIPLIEKGLENNIIVYDNESTVFSERLKTLMRTTAAQNGMGFLEIFILDEDMPGLTEYYLQTGGSLASGKTRLVIGIAEKNILLGSY